MQKQQQQDTVRVRGFSRVQIVHEIPQLEQIGGIYRPTPPRIEVVGDSGWVGPNQITNDGFLNYLVNLLAGTTGSLQVGFINIGTGGAPAGGDSALAGEITDDTPTHRQAITFAAVASTTAQFSATFSSGDSFITNVGGYNISNIGLYQHSTTNNLFAGNAYASSSCDTNQNVNTQYQIRFS